MLKNIVAQVNINHFAGNGTSQGMPAVGVAVTEHAHLSGRSINTVRDIALHYRGRYRHVSRGKSLGQRHHLRLHCHFVGAKISAETPEATDYLVVPQPNVVTIQHGLNRGKVAVWGHDDTAGTTHRLCNHCRDSVRTLGQNQRLQFLRSARYKIRLGFAVVRPSVIVCGPRAQHAEGLKRQLEMRVIGRNRRQRGRG